LPGTRFTLRRWIHPTAWRSVVPAMATIGDVIVRSDGQDRDTAATVRCRLAEVR
jgi:hypothetical protein